MKMKTYGIGLMAAIVLTMISLRPVSAQNFPWQDTTQSLEARVEWLVRTLTVDEKLSLMVHQNPAIPRVGLPAYSWWNEALHGVGRAGLATVYPMPIALAATFNPDLVREAFGQVAIEAITKYQTAQDTGFYGDYAGLTFFTPNINIFRDPRWGRGMETYGEDPYLTARMGLACVEGLQHGWAEDWQGRPLHTAACLKHFAVHSGPEGTRHEFDSRVSQRDLRSTYLPAFEYIIRKSDVRQVMCGYNRLNGSPCCTNRELFDILRNEWHYDGLLVTDCWALNDAYETDTVIPRHRTHATAALAYGDAFGREVDLECGSGLPALREAVEQGLVPESKVDEHVRRILRTRLEVTDNAMDPTIAHNYSESKSTANQTAAQSMVLLKNNGVLPLNKEEFVLVDGPNSFDTLMPLGNYNGAPREITTIAQEVTASHGPMRKAKEKTMVYVGGLNPQLEGEELQVEKEGFYKGDRTLVELPKEQVKAIKGYKKDGYRVVLVLCAGSAVSLEEVIDDCDAVLYAWYGGQEMSVAVRQLLFGERDDFGRLPVTIYRSTDVLPDFNDYAMQGRTYRYADRERVEFPFGYGLSYSYHQLWGAPTFDAEGMVVSGLVSQCNTDCNAPTHRTVVQIYLKNDADTDGPEKQLVGLQSVTTTSFDEKIPFRIQLEPFWLRQYNPATNRMEEPADGTRMTLQVGFSSDDKDLVDIPFTYRRPRPRGGE